MAFNPVKTHPIHDSLKRLSALQQSALLNVITEDLSEQHSWYLDRIFYLAHRAREQTKRRVSLAINLNALNNLHSSSESIINELNNYISNRNVGHIDTAFNLAEQGFQIFLQQAFPTDGKIDGAEADAALASLKTASQAAILELRNSKTKLLSEIETLSASVSTNLDSIGALSTEIETHKRQSAQEIENIKSSYASLTQEFGTKFEEMNQQWNETKEEKVSQIEADIEELVEKISEKETEARSLVQSVGEVLITGTYQKTAADEAKLANIFRWITIALFTTGILIVLSNYIVHIIAIFQGVSYDESPWTIAARFLTALVVSLPAFYTARESARHRTNADKARQRELELSTLGPFIELLPLDIKTQIRDRLTDRYFGNSVENHTFEPPINGDNMAKLAESIAKLIKPA